MFSGIVEECVKVKKLSVEGKNFKLKLPKPSTFNDLKKGDSLAVDGVCLTIETIENIENSDKKNKSKKYASSEIMSFSLGQETVKVLKLQERKITHQKVNLERSLKLNDRINGHLVTGHVDALGFITNVKSAISNSLILYIKLPFNLLCYIWQKGCITINGVSLTINEVNNDVISVCLIPETLRRTNLGFLKKGDFVNIEVDYLAKAIVRNLNPGTNKNEKYTINFDKEDFLNINNRKNLKKADKKGKFK